ncbi:hypothetical protein MKX01_039397 [Papaver californicum]|nr:hypothetical protein MKX01_039397 [Papaver californicum]
MDEDPQPPATKKSRGVAKLNFLTKVKKGEKVALEFCQREPAGPNTTQNGENFPFDIHDWSEKPVRKKKLKKQLQSLRVEKKIHEKWKANKRKMKVHHYNEENTEAQNRASCPREVIDTQWANMCKYWHSPEFKTKSENGKASRHIWLYLTMLVLRKTPNPISEVNHAQMEALEREDLEENRPDKDISNLEVTSPDRLNGDKYSKITGVEKPGRIRDVGLGIRVTKLKRSSSSNVGQNNEENAALRNEVKKLKKDHVIMQNNMQEERLQMKRAHEESHKKIDALLLLLTSGVGVLQHQQL